MSALSGPMHSVPGDSAAGLDADSESDSDTDRDTPLPAARGAMP